MKTVKISEIGIDFEEKLYIKPESYSFPDIYHEEIEIKWNSELKILHSPKPGEWSYLMIYSQIIKAAKNQGVQLIIDSNTEWKNISDENKRDIKILAGYKDA